MQDFATPESDPTHPLGERDRWPVTGPIYGIPAIEDESEPTRTIWQWLMAGTPEPPQSTASRPGKAPIWY